MTLTINFYWWMVPLAITIISAIPAINWRPRGDYDFTGAFLGLLWVCASGVAWAVAIIMRLMSWLTTA